MPLDPDDHKSVRRGEGSSNFGSRRYSSFELLDSLVALSTLVVFGEFSCAANERGRAIQRCVGSILVGAGHTDCRRAV
jgi:hypothetical protein